MSKRICIWGDSIVYGGGDVEEGGWVNRLALYLRREDRDHRVYNLGISGEITTETLVRFEVEAAARDLEQVVFAIGINDTQHLVAENETRVLLNDFSNNIKELITKARKFSNKITFINLTPVDEDKTNPIPWHTNRSYNNERIENYNKELEKICQKEKIEHIDIYSKFLEKDDYKILLFDGLHPNAEGHQLIFEVVKDNLKL